MSRWSVVIPFKGSTAAKSRLALADEHHASIEPRLRLRLSVAFVQDTVAAVTDTRCVGEIIVVTSDSAVTATMGPVTRIADPGQGLNAAIIAGITAANTLRPDAPVAVLTGDLPTLVSNDLQTALELADQYRLGVVPDHLGIGTTMITARPGQALIPHYGGSSHATHQRAGHTNLPLSTDSTVRQDVDTPRDLARALHRGVGPATDAVVQDAGESDLKVSKDRLHRSDLERTP